MAKITQDITKGKLLSAYCEAPFDEAKETLENKGYRIISLEENAKLRIQEGNQAYISRNGNWTREGFIYVPKKGIFLTKNSPVMENAKQATDCHRNGHEFYLDKKQVEKALENSVEVKEKSIPTDKFDDNEITVFAFGKTAEEYGQFLKDYGITEMPIYLADTKEKPFARQLWFWYLDDWSGLDGDDRDLDFDYSGLRGVHESAEGTAKNLYNKEQITKALKEANLSCIESILFENLDR